MHPELNEYAALPLHSDHLGDCTANFRKSEIVQALNEKGNEPEVTLFLLGLLRDKTEFDLARVEAIQVAAIYVKSENPYYQEVRNELQRLCFDDEEDDMIRGWAQRYIPET